MLGAQQNDRVGQLRQHAGRGRLWICPGEQAEAGLEFSRRDQHGFAARLLRMPALRDAQRLGEELLPVGGGLHDGFLGPLVWLTRR